MVSQHGILFFQDVAGEGAKKPGGEIGSVAVRIILNQFNKISERGIIHKAQRQFDAELLFDPGDDPDQKHRIYCQLVENGSVFIDSGDAEGEVVRKERDQFAFQFGGIQVSAFSCRVSTSFPHE
jgi:hypothetical protein